MIAHADNLDMFGLCGIGGDSETVDFFCAIFEIGGEEFAETAHRGKDTLGRLDF